MFLRTGVRLNTSVVEKFFKNWAAGDLEAAKQSFTAGAAVVYGGPEAVKKIPFTGKQSSDSFLDASSKALKIHSITPSDIQASEKGFFASAEVEATVARTEKKTAVPALFHGTFTDGKIGSLTCRPETGAWERAFSSHGDAVKGTENKWD